eukprot:GCRY01004554.1.p1 GENE.GCRY01004554.1~~GCRY01004554.1.p1  ORF type:complete len:445 (+),score=86.95 GCRY01004554.1:42-1376(+)
MIQNQFAQPGFKRALSISTAIIFIGALTTLQHVVPNSHTIAGDSSKTVETPKPDFPSQKKVDLSVLSKQVCPDQTVVGENNTWPLPCPEVEKYLAETVKDNLMKIRNSAGFNPITFSAFLEKEIESNPPPNNILELISTFRKNFDTILNRQLMRKQCPNSSIGQHLLLPAVDFTYSMERSGSDESLLRELNGPNAAAAEEVKKAEVENEDDNDPDEEAGGEQGEERREVGTSLGRCAVVSSSARMLGSGMGALIDSYDTVYRPGNATTEGFEDDVGSITHLRGFHAVRYLHSTELCVLYDIRKVIEIEDQCDYKGYVEFNNGLYAPIRLTPQMEDFVAHLVHQTFGVKPTSGFFSIATALLWCDSVDLFCFDSWNYNTTEFYNPYAKTHYYDTNQGHYNIGALHSFKRRRAHPFWNEYFFIKALQQQGLVHHYCPGLDGTDPLP